MTISPDDLVRREVHYCASNLIAKLCEVTHHDNDAELHDRVVEISAPVPDPKEAAIQNGWAKCYDSPEWYRLATDREEGSRDIQQLPTGVRHVFEPDATSACEYDDIDPYDYAREVLEHWIVSDWLADKLAEHGEAVDKDICELTIWGRTTTGQAISQDHVIQTICADLNKARGGVPLFDPDGKMHTAKGLPGTC